MDAEGFRQYYEYHFTVNRKVWEQSVAALTDEQFVQDLPYSIGSVRNQLVHMMSADDRWFCGLRGVDLSDHLAPGDFATRDVIRAYWSGVEARMRAYLAQLTGDELDRLFPGTTLKVWQVLLHVVNHSTDHRAQLLAMLAQFDVPTFPQDFVFYLLGRM